MMHVAAGGVDGDGDVDGDGGCLCAGNGADEALNSGRVY